MAQRLTQVKTVPAFKGLVLFLSVCFSVVVQAQVFYSVKPDYLKSKTEQNNILTKFRNDYPDTSITEQINFFPRNYLGNLGLASPEYIWRYRSEDLGFRLVQSPLTNDRIRESEIKYFRSTGPYANLNGIAGSREYQAFRMLFTHTYKAKVNITVAFNRYASRGFYKRQNSFANNFYLTSNYTTKKKRAGYYLYMLNNGNRNRENGGIADGVLTDSSMIYDKSLFKVNLRSADRDNRETKFMVNPWLRLNKSDSAGVHHYLQVKARYALSSLRYMDQGLASDSFYRAAYLDTAVTHDSVHVKKFLNGVSYALRSRDEKFGFSAGYDHEINYVWQFNDSVFTNHIAWSELVFRAPLLSGDSALKKERYFETRLHAQFVAAGANAGNYKAESNTIYTFNDLKRRHVFFNLLYESRNPDQIYNTWISNHFYWLDNGFKPQSQMQAQLGLNFNKTFNVSVFYQSINNYLYFDRQALPKQFSKTIVNTGLSVNFSRVFFRHLGVGLHHVYQNTSHPGYVRVPQHVSTAKLFYHGSLSHNNLTLQIGAQLQVYEAFQSYAYMPATQLFYLQDNFTTSRYPFLDVYVSARIRPVSFFVKVENVLKGLAGPDYAFTPGYYQTDLALRFGLTWMFFD